MDRYAFKQDLEDDNLNLLYRATGCLYLAAKFNEGFQMDFISF